MTAVNPDRLAFQPDRPETTSEKKSKKGLIIGGTALAATLALGGAIFGGTAGGKINMPNGNENLPPAPEPSVSAPETPGATEAPTTPTPVETVANPIPAGPEHIENYEQLVEEAKIVSGEYASGADALPAFAEQFNKFLNFQPSDEELASYENLVSEKTGATGRLAAAEIYRSAFDDVFIGGGSFYNTLEEEAKVIFEKWYQTKDKTEENIEAYAMKWTVNEQNQFVYSDNSELNSLPDSPTAFVYNIPADPVLSNLTPENQNPDDRIWQFPGNAPLVYISETDK